MAVGNSILLGLPFEVRQAVYEQLLSNAVVHPCSDESQLNHYCVPTGDSIQAVPVPDDRPRTGTPGSFFDELMECSGKHYQSLIKPGKWSNVCSPSYPFKVSDMLHFMLACKKIYLELEPLFWSKITLAIGLPSFSIFFEQYLSTPLRSLAPEVVARAQVLPRLVLLLPRIEELRSQMCRGDKRYTLYAADACIKERLEQSLDHMTSSCPSVRSVEVIIDAAHFEFSSEENHIIVYAGFDVAHLLRFQGLKDFAVTYCGDFSPSYYQTVFADRRLKSCERALWEMVTGKGEPLDLAQNRTGWVGTDHSVVEEDDPRLWGFCERVIRHYNTGWKGSDVKD